MDILIKNIDLRGVLLLTPNAIFKPVEGHDHEKIVQKWEIVKEAEIKTLPPHGRLVDLDAFLEARKNMATWEEYLIGDIDNYFENPSVVILERTT